jgi:hypothetical protein
MAVLYQETRNLWVPIICHAANNIVFVLLSLLLPSPKSATPEQIAGDLPILVLVGFVVVAVAGSWAIYFAVKKWRHGTWLLSYPV